MRRRDFLRALVAAPIAAAAPPIVAAFLAEQPRQIGGYVWRPARDSRIRGAHATLLIIDDPPARFGPIERAAAMEMQDIVDRYMSLRRERCAVVFTSTLEPPCDPS